MISNTSNNSTCCVLLVDSMPKEAVGLSGEVQGVYSHFGHHPDILASSALQSVASTAGDKTMHLPSNAAPVTLKDEPKGIHYKETSFCCCFNWQNLKNQFIVFMYVSFKYLFTL